MGSIPKQGAGAAGAVTDGAVTDGAVTDGAVTDGAVTDGTVTDGPVTVGSKRPSEKASDSNQGGEPMVGTSSFPMVDAASGASLLQNRAALAVPLWRCSCLGFPLAEHSKAQEAGEESLLEDPPAKIAAKYCPYPWSDDGVGAHDGVSGYGAEPPGDGSLRGDRRVTAGMGDGGYCAESYEEQDECYS